jgi:hypothetical protein
MFRLSLLLCLIIAAATSPQARVMEFRILPGDSFDCLITPQPFSQLIANANSIKQPSGELLLVSCINYRSKPLNHKEVDGNTKV